MEQHLFWTTGWKQWLSSPKLEIDNMPKNIHGLIINIQWHAILSIFLSLSPLIFFQRHWIRMSLYIVLNIGNLAIGDTVVQYSYHFSKFHKYKRRVSVKSKIHDLTKKRNYETPFAFTETQNSILDTNVISILCMYAFYRNKEKKTIDINNTHLLPMVKSNLLSHVHALHSFPKWRSYIAQIWSHKLIKLEFQPSLRSFSKTNIVFKWVPYIKMPIFRNRLFFFLCS